MPLLPLCLHTSGAYGPIINYRDVLTLSIEIIDIYNVYIYESLSMAHRDIGTSFNIREF
jgi:hypothetical protein